MRRQQGAVSIFVVIFAMLLFTAVSVGFTVLMLRDQDRATDNDLSQSALDSSKAGIEDAKRVLAQYNACLDSAEDAPTCTNIVDRVRSGDCDTVGAIVGNPGEETRLKQSEGDRQLEQAYTCVKIQPDTEDVVKTIKDEGDIKIIPLKAKGNYSTVEISWVEKGSDLTADFAFTDKEADGLKAHDDAEILPKDEAWRKEEWGSILRVQAFSYKPGDVSLGAIDAKARTAFLYPSALGVATPTTIDMAAVDVDSHTPIPPFDAEADDLEGAYNRPQQVKCDDTSGESGEYACTAILKNVRAGSDTAYLAVAGVYARAGGDSFKVRMLDDGGSAVLFDGVQPIIDSTGRANDVFRRVQARVETSSSQEDAMPLPRVALGVRGSVCKNYTVTDSSDDYVPVTCSAGAPDPTLQPDGATPDGAALIGGDAPGVGTPGGGDTPGGGGPIGSLPSPYNMMIGGKEYTITPRLVTEEECTGWPWNRTCEDVRYAEHVYTATEEECTGWPWNRTCEDVQVEKIYKTERL